MSYSKEKIIIALSLYKVTKSTRQVLKTLGYPSQAALYKWLKKYKDNLTKPNRRAYKRATAELKQQAIQRCLLKGESVKLVAEDIGYAYITVYQWIRSYKEKGICNNMKKANQAKPANLQTADNIEELKEMLLDMQMEIDILRETINVIKKDPGVDQKTLKNREKAVIIVALKNKYSLPKLCKKLLIPKSSYYYQLAVLQAEDKYSKLRQQIIKMFNDNKRVYGYRRMYQVLVNEGTIVSEKVIRRIMKEEGLVVKVKKKRKYNSYQGELSLAPDNLLKRDFHANKANEKWLTDITEFSIKAGKVYLSPIIDCLDGMPISWKIGRSPNAVLVNSMLEEAINTLKADEKPIIHSDRGCHYRWPEWIKLVEKAGLTRSMSKKGCSPDNSACEGFFGHLKNEMFYNRNWDNCSLAELTQEIDSYIRWYREKRIKLTLGGISPLQYRKELGITV